MNSILNDGRKIIRQNFIICFSYKFPRSLSDLTVVYKIINFIYIFTLDEVYWFIYKIFKIVQ